jgi:hypothetical protein
MEQVRYHLSSTVEAVRADPAASNFLVRGPSLAEGEPTAVTFDAQTTADAASDVIAYSDALLTKEWIAYDPSYQLASNQALVDELAQVPELARLHAAVVGGSMPLDSSSSSAGRVVAMVHRVRSTPELSVTAYRLKGQGIATRRPRGIRILVPRDGVFERIDGEVLYYEPGFDALVVGDHVIVTAISTLQRSLGSTERARRMAALTFTQATAQLAIEGADALADAVATDPAMVAKMAQLARILEAEPEYAQLLTTARILDFLDHNPHIPIATTGQGDERRLLFESSPQKRYLIVKALADDYLRSELSQRTYEVGSKVQIPE